VKAAPFALLVAASAILAAAAKAQPEQRFEGSTPLEWSQRLARSEMKRRGKTLFFGEDSKATWNYTSGFLAYALSELGREARIPDIEAFGTRIVDSFIADDGTIRGYQSAEENLDLILPGRVILGLFNSTRAQKYRSAAGSLRRQLSTQPRTAEGGFWHKRIYPEQMWLDGLYMSGPFYAQYGVVFKEAPATADAFEQIVLADRHLYDPSTGLYYHAWDSRSTQAWADPASGHSRSFWGRAIGWLAMAAADELDDVTPPQPAEPALRDVLRRVCGGIVRWQDQESGVWWQVTDQGPRAGNYHESSASCMFVYTLAKSVERGWLPRGEFEPAALHGYAGLIREFMRVDASGHASISHCCSVAGLNNRNSAGRERDGTFDYYVSEPVVDNDPKAVSAFILAGLEVQRMLGPVQSTP
jgi:unsaturated rhamnogalacturonyl hydrolase